MEVPEVVLGQGVQVKEQGMELLVKVTMGGMRIGSQVVQVVVVQVEMVLPGVLVQYKILVGRVVRIWWE